MNDEERKYCVYCHTNRVNGKKYVGVTCQKPEVRWGKNGSKYVDQPVFFSAIEEYTWDEFTHEIVQEGLSKDEASEVEKELISKYNTTDRANGYNISPGGGGILAQESIDKIIQFNKVAVFCITLNREFPSVKEAGEELNICKSGIIACCKGRQETAGGYKFRYVDESKSKKVTFNKNQKKYLTPVKSLEDGKIYPSIKSVEEELHICLSGVLDNPRRTSNGMHWVRLVPKKVINMKNKRVRNVTDKVLAHLHKGKPVINLDTGKIYSTSAEARRDIKREGIAIKRCCSGKAFEAGGYRWAWVDENNNPIEVKRRERSNKNKPKRVLCVDTNTTYESIAEASRITGIGKTCIGACCQHKTNTAGGFVWEFLENPVCTDRPGKKDRTNCSVNKPVMCVETGEKYKSAAHAFRLTGIPRRSIGDCCNGKQWTAGGYHWSFISKD